MRGNLSDPRSRKERKNTDSRTQAKMVIRSCEVVFVLGEVVDRSQARVQNPDSGSLGWRLAPEVLSVLAHGASG